MDEPTDTEILQMMKTCKERYGKCTPRLFNQDAEFCSLRLVRERFEDEESEKTPWRLAKEAAGMGDEYR